jgi:hypothetical protein
MDLRRPAARLAYRLGLRRLGRMLQPDPGTSPLDVSAIVARYRWPVNGGHASDPAHWTNEISRYQREQS